MKKIIFIIIAFLSIKSYSQERSIITAAPFLKITPDSRSGGMGDVGVATSADVYSQYSNAAKYLFAESDSGISFSYNPWLNKIVNDVFFANLTYYTKFNDRSSLGVGFTYFKIGEIQKYDLIGTTIIKGGTYKPNEMSIDVSYGLKLSDNFGMAVTGRYIRSDLFDRTSNFSEAKVGNGFSVDVSGFFESKEIRYRNFSGKYRLGFNISNIGPKIDYTSSDDNDGIFLPTNLKLGAGYDFMFDDDNKLGVTVEMNKLLVPTPSELVEGSTTEYKVPNEGVVNGIFSSFGDAPDGFSEELQEMRFAIATEYWYRDILALRAGYHFANEDKGGRNFLSLGAGIKYDQFGFDVAYLISTSDRFIDPLENSLRFSISYDLGFSN